QAMHVLAAAKAAGVSADVTSEPVNLLPNADMERHEQGAPTAWTDLRRYSGAARDAITVRTSPHGRNGSQCLELRSDRFTDSGLAVTLQLEPGARYRLTGWVRTENVVPAGRAPGMMLNVHGG